MIKIIIVDDEKASLNSMGRVIKSIRKDVEVAGLFSSVQLAKEFLSENSADIILSDIKMPGEDGIALARFVSENYPDIKIVFFSAYSDFEYAQQAISLNVKHYLLKPVNIDELNRTLNHLIELIEKEAKDREEKSLKEKKYTELLGIAKTDLYPEKPDDAKKAKTTLELIKKYIEENYMYDIILEDIASYVNLSSFYTSKLFKAKTGQGISDYITSVRINAAIELMKSRKYKVYEISQMCGYTSRKYFSHSFKQHTGCTPSEYQRKL